MLESVARNLRVALARGVVVEDQPASHLAVQLALILEPPSLDEFPVVAHRLGLDGSPQRDLGDSLDGHPKDA